MGRYNIVIQVFDNNSSMHTMKCSVCSYASNGVTSIELLVV